jgi:hypothetical protein
MHVYISRAYIQRLGIISEMYNLINVQYSFGTIAIVFHEDMNPWKHYPQIKSLKNTLDRQYNCKQIFMPPFKSPLYISHSEVGLWWKWSINSHY